MSKKPSVGPNSPAAKALAASETPKDPAPVLPPKIEPAPEEQKQPEPPAPPAGPSEPSKPDQIRMGSQQLQQQIVTKKLEAFDAQRQYDGLIKQIDLLQAQANAIKPQIEGLQLEIGAMEMTLNNQLQAVDFLDPQQK